MNSETFLWYDFETFGADPRRDRPAQFAAIRTDAELQPVGEPEVFYCQPASDMLPHPAACLITGITPQMARDRGLPENEFARRIFELMSVPGTCTVGYNNFRFDDEVTRHLFWRNFFDPYVREYANGNSRFDLIDLLRMTRALRPAGIQWPDYEDGRPSFRLEDVAAANGIDTTRAHDALADVEATIEMARLVRHHNPKLWDWALKLRQKSHVVDLLHRAQPLLHSSSRYPAQPGCNTAAVLPLRQHPRIASQWLVWNLEVDPIPFLDRDEETLADLYWTPEADLPDDLQRVPVKLLRTNRCPMISPLGVLDRASSERLQIVPGRIESHAEKLRQHPAFLDRLTGIFNQPLAATDIDPELDLYGGFPPPGDQRLYPRIRDTAPEDLARLQTPFSDERLNELLFRYRARLWPDTLDADETERWETYRRKRLIDNPDLATIRRDEYRLLLEQLRTEQPQRQALFDELAAWPGQLGLVQEP
ncbi:exodeoxyribonuclease I [Wenzhouxiangella sp. AB-CW3]|uniref:exodeoxyribonuclease I n=1 Tax=Wenzhouxiangella sp. AB-CW3 TaxID=2771012 RepID=UPI00168A472E|nr:exodeoxyribonuclease I [Wenzhouxiangella sp. AB-CW3]QOC23849.1 exodeoxyribonuclease I [Wenzhouxiangella sp. AB-CW3]